EVLKDVTPSVFRLANGIWTKSMDAEYKEPVAYPYSVTNIAQYAPPRSLLERFERRRNELDKSLPLGRRLETINCFFHPTSEAHLRRLLLDGWTSFNAADIVFHTNACRAIKEGNTAYPKLVIVRLSLGRDGVDYTNANGRYRVRDLSSAITSFILGYKSSTMPNAPYTGVSSSPLQSKLQVQMQQKPKPLPTFVVSTSSSASINANAIANSKFDASGAMKGDGMTCLSCRYENAGNTKYCCRCGGHL
ncbi:hypothetical protein SAMD00019534_080000, partial [Acytostelium subglobosum LB1]|uniref:hypothetical protein n=1 Tax=Acytostelium subglobosum LB1 TaxID=1410327 RepID=UPI000644D10A